MAGSVLAIGVLAVAAAVTLGMSAVGGAAVVSQRVSGAADAAALAAADGASGAVSGEPCDRAGAVAAASGALLTQCATAGLIATVTVVARYAGVEVSASARAGPPP